MKQILQNMKDGRTIVEEVPIPGLKPKMALVQTAASLVSAGTERMLVEFAEKNLIEKASSRPDLVRQVISKAKREGLLSTIEAAFNKLDQPMALGYSSAGTILEVDERLTGFKPGDRVACAGGGYAVHAEYAVVPGNLMAHLPDNVEYESAAFATLGTIALHGFRLSSPQIGESVCVIGLGLLGLLSAQIARAAGCIVFGIDLSIERVKLAKELGFPAASRESCIDMVPGVTNGKGFDHVLICADTSSNDPVELAGHIARDRASIVAVGAVGLEIPRKLYYEKELVFKISRSYGPGRYDPLYEESGIDYPVGYVRWTEGRNLQGFIDLLEKNSIDVKPLISHRFQINDASKAYELITGKMKSPYMGVVLTYPNQDLDTNHSRRVDLRNPEKTPVTEISVGVLGAGNYAQAVFLPIMKKTGRVSLSGVVTSSGLTAKHAAQKFSFSYASSSEEQVINDPGINTVVILTRHDQHARQVISALENKKYVYCEKPLAINQVQLDEIEKVLQDPECPLLTVGFNRRFSSMAIQLANFFRERSEPMMVNYRVNAGFLPLTHWLHDPDQGGGRIVGEGCHFIDFLTFLTSSLPTSVFASALADNGKYHQDNVFLIFKYPDSSIGTVTYLANGNKNSSKERIEVFSSGKIGILDDFRSLELITDGSKHFSKSRLRQDKGHASAWSTFLDAISSNGQPPIPYRQLISTTRASFAAVESLQTGKEIKLQE